VLAQFRGYLEVCRFAGPELLPAFGDLADGPEAGAFFASDSRAWMDWYRSAAFLVLKAFL
jgi:hypothetical protein